MKTLLAILFLCVSVQAQGIRSLGTITTTNSVGWDGVADKFHIYLAETNSTNFARVATVTNLNRWPGDSTKDINGPKLLYIEGENAKGVGDPSEIVLVTFRAGVPLPPTNIQLYSVVMAAATNALPPMPK